MEFEWAERREQVRTHMHTHTHFAGGGWANHEINFSAPDHRAKVVWLHGKKDMEVPLYRYQRSDKGASRDIGRDAHEWHCGACLSSERQEIE